MAAVAGLYRRALPSPPCIEFASKDGKQLFSEALLEGYMEGFFKLVSYYKTQSEPAYCGLATLAVVLNALAIDPGRKWKGPWRWFDDSMLDCCEPLEKVKVSGISFNKVACLAHCNGAEVDTYHTNESTLDNFRNYVISCTSSENCHMIVSYHRSFLKQTGGGHFSPIGGYHAGKDMVLILDVARFKYPPHWVPLTLLWDAMNTVDKDTGFYRGFMLLTRFQASSSILYTLSCRHDGWDTIAKYLSKKLQQLLSSEEIHNIQDILSVILASAPADLSNFINWVAEVRKQENGSNLVSEEEQGRLVTKEEVLQQVRETELFKHLTRWFLSGSSCMPKAILDGTDSLEKIASEVCCQGAQLFCGKVGSCGAISSKTTQLRSSDCDNAKSVTVVSANVVVEDSVCGAEILVPSCQKSPGNPCECGLNTSDREHPSVVDGLTVLLLALPPDTWSCLKDAKLLKEFCGIISPKNLPDLLKQEILHLRKQLYFLVTDVCCSST
ncbi:glutathione gamma-glutamylcysteinyltransferase 3-like [Chenopodium quinoa]|uniref:glutathione gamma-glutamylcysteinyltransferase 3-like n=1 Tax=Chenopodium quinoa TaxID=63459 RepID=UPI000B7773B8|nr:glutathione gamma-glutamylcysteinyltransferase 3-like [Chenopodium quinoa]